MCDFTSQRERGHASKTLVFYIAEQNKVKRGDCTSRARVRRLWTDTPNASRYRWDRVRRLWTDITNTASGPVAHLGKYWFLTMNDENSFYTLFAGYAVFFTFLFLANKTRVGHVVLYYGLILVISSLILSNYTVFTKLLKGLQQ